MFTINRTRQFPTPTDFARFTALAIDSFDIVDSFFLEELPKLQPAGYWRIGPQENRPDMLSYVIYGTTNYWWILMAYNGLTDFTAELPANYTIPYPSPSDVAKLISTAGSF